MERKRTQSGVIYDDDDEEEEDKDRKISTRERKKARYTENPENEEEESEEEEEEERENRDRRISPRKIKRPIYAVVVDDDDDDDEDDEDDKDDNEEEVKQEKDRDNNKNGDKEEEDNEQPGPSTKDTRNQGTCEHNTLKVTCGNKTGILDVKKLERSEDCITSGDRWFSPSAFEIFGGKGSAKKWKTSILHEDKPLQFLFEQGALTTSGYKRRRPKTTKQPKLPSWNHTSSESSSEESVIQSADETQEDVEDEDWLPGSEELLLETEEVKGRVENGGEIVDSGDDKSEEVVDEMEKGEVEDEDVAAVADNDNSGFEEREAKSISSISEKSALLKKVEVVIRRLSKMEYPSMIKGSEEENENEFTQSNEIKDDGQREITTENGDTPTSLHPPATSFQDIKPKMEDIGSTSNHAANLSSSCVQFSAIDMKEAGDCGEEDKEGKRREMGPETQWTGGFDENSNNELVRMSRSEASDHPVATGDIEDAATSPIQGCVKEEDGDPPTEPLNALVECKYENTDATTFNNDAARLKLELDARVLQTTQTSDITQTFVMVAVPSSQPSTSCDLDTMDLDQLRREKIKMQIKVLRLQEQYYTRKIKELKN